MAVLVVPNTVRVAFKGRWTNNQPWVNTLAVEVKTDGVQTSRPEVRNAYMPRLSGLFQSDLVQFFPNNYTYEGMDFVDLHALDGETGTIAPDTGKPTVGPVTGAQAPPSVTLLVRKVLNQRTRGRRNGRWYLPGVDETTVDENGVAFQTTIDTWNTRLATFLGHANDDGGGALPIGSTVNVGVISNPVKAGLPATLLLVSALTAQTRVATQRRHLTWD